MDDFVYFVEESDIIDEEGDYEYCESSEEIWQRMLKRKRDREWKQTAEHFNMLAAIKKMDSIMRFRSARNLPIDDPFPEWINKALGLDESDDRAQE